MNIKRVIATAGVSAILGVGSLLAGSGTAQACVWDPSWFFLHTCNNPPAEPAPPGPPAPMIACDETHCGPDVPIPCSGPGAPC